MKIAVNCCYGGFSLSDEIAKKYNLDKYNVSRTNECLIKLIESGVAVDGRKASNIRVRSIPDTATDWQIMDYDGLETIIYVVNGKIHYA